MAKKEMDAKMRYLFEGILSLQTVEECSRFFEDLCTVVEAVSYTHLDVYKRQSYSIPYAEIIK